MYVAFTPSRTAQDGLLTVDHLFIHAQENDVYLVSSNNLFCHFKILKCITDACYYHQNVDDMVTTLNDNVHRNLLNRFAPLKSRRVRHTSKRWFNNEIKQAMEEIKVAYDDCKRKSLHDAVTHQQLHKEKANRVDSLINIAIGDNDIPLKFLNLIIPTIAHHILHIFNYCISQPAEHYHPADWNKVIIKPPNEVPSPLSSHPSEFCYSPK